MEVTVVAPLLPVAVFAPLMSDTRPLFAVTAVAVPDTMLIYPPCSPPVTAPTDSLTNPDVGPLVTPDFSVLSPVVPAKEFDEDTCTEPDVNVAPSEEPEAMVTLPLRTAPLEPLTMERSPPLVVPVSVDPAFNTTEPPAMAIVFVFCMEVPC